MQKYEDVFALRDLELGYTHCIDTGNQAPIKPYHIPMSRMAKISDMIDDMLQQGVIKPSVSPWASPVVLVPKKDSSLHFGMVDFVTRKNVYPLRRIVDNFNSLGDTRYFTSLDLASGYWQVVVDPQASKTQLLPPTEDSMSLCECHLRFAMPQQHFNVSYNRC